MLGDRLRKWDRRKGITRGEMEAISRQIFEGDGSQALSGPSPWQFSPNDDDSALPRKNSC